MRHLLLALLCALALPAEAAVDSAARPTTGALQVLRAVPAGEDVLAERQVVFTFDRAVVPLGDMARTAAQVDVQVEPALACEWRWLDTSSLACQLGEGAALQRATRYRFTIGRGLRTESGVGLAKPYVHEFVTERPKLESYNSYRAFHEWRTPGMPVVRMSFGYDVLTDSVARHMYFMFEGERVPVVLERAPDERPRPGEPADASVLDVPAVARVMLVRPAREVGPDQRVDLWVEPGIRTPLGTEPSTESRAVLSTWSMPLPRFLGVRCQVEGGSYRGQLLRVDEDLSGREPCDPMSQIVLMFSTPMLPDDIKAQVRFTPDLAGGRQDYDPWAAQEEDGGYGGYGDHSVHRPHERHAEYSVALPTLVRADEEHHVFAAPGALTDAFGRPLAEGIDFRYRTAPRPPRLVFDHTIAALERDADSDLPLVVTNIERLEVDYRTVTNALPVGATKPTDRTLTDSGRLQKSIALPVLKDVSFYTPLGLRDLLGARSGLVVGYLDTVPDTGYSRGRSGIEFFTQVTPWQVHVKLGHFNSLVWVTDLATGKPVNGARVRVMEDDLVRPGDGKERATATTGADGVAVLPGASELDPSLAMRHTWERGNQRLMVFVDRGPDLAVVPVHSAFQSYSGVWPHQRRADGHTRAWGMTAQGVYRPGDTVQYKVWVRAQDNRSLVAPSLTGYTLVVSDPTGEEVFQREDVELNEFGTVAGELPIAATAPVGWYQFELRHAGMGMSWQTMRVLVSDFTPASFRVSTEVAGDQFQPGDTMQTSTHARLHAGGPYGKAQARVTVSLQATGLSVEDPVARGFSFDTWSNRAGSADESEYGYEYEGYGDRGPVQLFQGEGELDEQGDLGLPAILPDNPVMYGRLSVESAVRDDRGKYMAGTASATWFGRDRFVGLRTSRWMYPAGSPAEVEFLVVDQSGQRVAGTPVELVVERRVTQGARVKGAGNAYLMRYTHSWEEVQRCDATATIEPGTCSFTPAKPGRYRMIASIADTRGRAHRGERHLWVTGPGEVLWEDDNTGAVRLVPERTRFAVGERARVMVQNPLPGATALITLERYGILKRWTQKLEGSTPVIEFPIDADMVPGAWLSVLITSPRVDKPLEVGQVDLGKPTLRMGYLELRVDDAAKRLAVSARAGKPEYRPQDEVAVELRVGPGDAGIGKPIEYAVVVLDEAVFDLIQGGDTYFDPHAGLWSLGNLDVANYNLLMTLVGRQKYEKKGANPGGDGGLDFTPRSDFKFVAYWNPALRAGPDGKASIRFKVPDNLTGWRVIAMANDSADRLGVGVGNFKVNRPTEVRPVMPNQVTSGDRFDAGFSVMNRTAAARTLTVDLAVQGPVAADSPASRRSEVRLEPYARSVVFLPVRTEGQGELRFTASARDAEDRDGVLHTVPVKPQRVTETAADWGTTFVPNARISLKFPSAMRPDAGTVGVTVSPTVLGNLDGAFGYLRDYPYACWEQRLTQGVGAMHYNRLRAYLGPQVSWPGADALPKRLLDDAASFQAPNGGMSYWIASDQYVSPYLSVYTARAFGWLRRSGHVAPSAVEGRLDRYVADLLKRDAVPTFYDGGMTATVRAVALAALADRGRLDVRELERFRPHVGRMSLFGKANFLEAAVKAKAPAATAQEVATQILASAVQSAGKVSFNERLSDSYRQLLATPLRDQCAVLSALVAYGETPAGATQVGDLPFKLVRSIVAARGNRDHWENTQENAFCMNGLLDYARAYEKTDPAFTVKAMLDTEVLGEASFKAFRDPAQVMQRAIRPDDLGQSRTVNLSRTGEGRMYYTTRMTYVPLGAAAGAANAGIELVREYSVERDGTWVRLETPMQIQRGELVRVDLFLSTPTTRHLLVLDDPVPGGLEPVNRDLATASTVDAAKGDFKAAAGSWWYTHGDWNEFGVSQWAFYHRELRHDSARFYADYLPPGKYHLSYTAQAVATGEFSVMSAKAEEMYDPDVFGRAAPGVLEVREQ